MAAAKAKTEQTHLLSSAASPTSRNTPSLTQMATERLGSLKWLMARDVTISPQARPPSRPVSGSNAAAASAAAAGTSEPYSAIGTARPPGVPQRGPVRRSVSADVDAGVTSGNKAMHASASESRCL